MQFLRTIPLVDRVWIPEQIVLLAEWGAQLEASGFTIGATADASPFAWDLVAAPVEESQDDSQGGAAVPGERKNLSTPDVPDALRASAATRLSHFSGRTRTIDNTLYWHYQDYHDWRDRQALALPPQEIGILLRSWNAWVGTSAAAATSAPAAASADSPCVADVRMRPLKSTVDGFRYGTMPDALRAGEDQRRRQELLASVHRNTLSELLSESINENASIGASYMTSNVIRDSYLDQVLCWLQHIEELMQWVSGLQAAATRLSERYFEAQNILFPETSLCLRALTDSVKSLVADYNRGIANELDQWQKASDPSWRGESCGGANSELCFPLEFLVCLRVPGASHSMTGRTAGLDTLPPDLGKGKWEGALHEQLTVQVERRASFHIDLEALQKGLRERTQAKVNDIVENAMITALELTK